MSSEKKQEAVAPEVVKKGLMATLWPVERFERKKVIPLIAMMFLMCFNYTLLRDIKDVLVLNAIGPASMVYLKLFFVLPSAVVFMFVVNKATKKLLRFY